MNAARFRSWLAEAGFFRVLSGVLILIVVVMLIVWQPWQPSVKATDRTISVTGTATITAVPDQYIFSPSYTFTNSNKQTALDALTTKSSTIVAKLKQLGVADKDIKTNANGFDNYGYYIPVYQGNDTYTLTITVTVQNVSLAQKVQDYLVTTTPSGTITPDVSFSIPKQQALEQQARNVAEQNARSQADQSARNLGFSVAAVKSVVDGSLYAGGPIMYDGLSAGTNLSSSAKSSLAVEPGQNDLSYSVQVIYYIR